MLFPCPIQILFWVWAGSIHMHRALSSVGAALTLVWSCDMEQEGLEWVCVSSWGAHMGGHGWGSDKTPGG